MCMLRKGTFIARHARTFRPLWGNNDALHPPRREIDVTPRFSWLLPLPSCAVSQKSYRFTVSAVSAGSTDVWDYGVVTSSLPYLRQYADPALRSDTTYFWSVNVVSTSAASTFTTGFLTQSDWNLSVWIGKKTTVVPASLRTAFTSASWIWASEPSPPNASPGDVALRFTYATPAGKIPASATVVITVDDRFTFYTNDPPQRKPFPLSRVLSLHILRNPRDEPPRRRHRWAGVILAALITFTDGSTALVSVTAAWKATASIPANFQPPAVSDASWAAASALGSYGIATWDTATAASDAPAGALAFCRTFISSASKAAASAAIVITAEDQFSLWVNGALRTKKNEIMNVLPDIALLWLG
ncbi:hypothetical protein C8R44DRAFT_753641 [Mycena epipterygia]|nr:hypothetical protein C8R44DRAFT_753641 [Mycena epipterygia]